MSCRIRSAPIVSEATPSWSPPSVANPLSVNVKAARRKSLLVEEGAKSPPSRGVGRPSFQQNRVLRFVDKVVEEQFRTAYFNKFKVHRRVVIYVGLVAWIVFLIRNLVRLQEPGSLAQVAVRCSCVVVTAFVMISMHSKHYHRFWEPIMLALGISWALVLLSMAAISYSFGIPDPLVNLRVAFVMAAALVSSKVLLLAQLGWFMLLVSSEIFVAYVMHVPALEHVASSLVLFLGLGSSYTAERVERRVFVLSETLKIEQQKTSEFLQLMLPPSVVSRLLSYEVVADEFTDVTVMFAEIDHFVEYSEKFTPQQVVDSLNSVYSNIEKLLVKTDIYQVESMGEQALLISGCPVLNVHHAEAMARFALQLVDKVGDHRWPDGQPMMLRIGMHSGTVVASVIGKKRPQYNIIGDSVNTAARMLSKCTAGSIRVSPSTKELLASKFDLLSLGIQEFKGKGLIETFNLLREKPLLEKEKAIPETALHTPTTARLNPLKPTYATTAFSSEYSKAPAATPLFSRRGKRIVPELAIDPATPTPPTNILGSFQDLREVYLSRPVLPPVQRIISTTSSSKSELVDRGDAQYVLDSERDDDDVIFLDDEHLYLNRTHLRFRSEHLEQTYRSYSSGRIRLQQRYCFAMMFILYVVTTPFFLMMENFQLQLLGRLGNLIASLLCFILTYWSRWTLISKPVMILFGAWHCSFALWEKAWYLEPSDPEVCEVANGRWLVGLCVLMVFFELSGLTFTSSVIFALVIAIAMVVGALFSCDLSVVIPYFEPLSYLLLCMVFALIAKFSSNKKFREEYVLARRTECEKMSLSDLIENILPPHASQCLLSGRSLPVQTYESVTLLFSDIVGFTSLSTRLSPREMRSFLHSLYKKFDDLSEAFGVYKVATIGDAYIAAAGCPDECLNHAERVLQLAFGMQEAIRSVKHPKIDNIQMRIGIHSGSVFAGLTGTHTPHFHLFGPSCHVAHSLESLAPPGGILVSETTTNLLPLFPLVLSPLSRQAIPGTTLVAHTVVPRSTSSTLSSLSPNSKLLPRAASIGSFGES